MISLVTITSEFGPTTFGLILVMYGLSLGYTIPPLKLSYRGLGKIDVAITHSLGIILCGFHFQGGTIFDPFPWLLSLPFFLAIFPSIILAGIPDHDAYKVVGKKTLAVRLGPKNAMVLALVFTALSATVALLWFLFDIVPDAYGWATLAIIPHAVFLSDPSSATISEHPNRHLLTD